MQTTAKIQAVLRTVHILCSMQIYVNENLYKIYTNCTTEAYDLLTVWNKYTTQFVQSFCLICTRACGIATVSELAGLVRIS